MNITSWNVNSLNTIVKKDFFESVNKMNPDILCLQETKAQDEKVREILMPLSNYFMYCNSAEKRGYSGTALLCKNNPIKVITDINVVGGDTEGRLICAEYSNFYLVNVYVPNSGQQLERLEYRKNWDTHFLHYLKKLENLKPVIVCGDFNVAHLPIDLTNNTSNYNKTAGYTQIEIDGMNHLINAGFVDAYRYLHPNEVAYSFWSYRFNARARNIGWRIDYFLISKSLTDKIKKVKILSDVYGSDHCPISLEINY